MSVALKTRSVTVAGSSEGGAASADAQAACLRRRPALVVLAEHVPPDAEGGQREHEQEDQRRERPAAAAGAHRGAFGAQRHGHLLGGTRRSGSVGRSLGPGAGPRSHRRPARRVPAPRRDRCARRSREVSLPAIAPAADRATIPAMIAANLKKANPTYQFRSDRSAPVRCGVPLGDLAPGREAGQRGHRAQRRGALLAGLRPVDEHHPEVGERVAQRRHLPVEDRLDPARLVGVEQAVVQPVVAVDDARPLGRPAPSRPAGRRGRRGPGGRGRGWRPTAWSSGAPGGRRSPPGRPKSDEADRVVVDRVQVGEHVDQAARRPPGAAPGSSA